MTKNISMNLAAVFMSLRLPGSAGDELRGWRWRLVLAEPRHAGIIRQGRGEEMASATPCKLSDSALSKRSALSQRLRLLSLGRVGSVVEMPRSLLCDAGRRREVASGGRYMVAVSGERRRDGARGG